MLFKRAFCRLGEEVNLSQVGEGLGTVSEAHRSLQGTALSNQGRSHGLALGQVGREQERGRPAGYCVTAQSQPRALLAAPFFSYFSLNEQTFETRILTNRNGTFAKEKLREKV